MIKDFISALNNALKYSSLINFIVSLVITFALNNCPVLFVSNTFISYISFSSHLIFFLTLYNLLKCSLLDVINEHIKKNEKFTKKEIVTVAKILSIIAYKFKSSNIIFRNFSSDNIFFLKENHYLTLNVRNFYFSTIVNKTRMTNGIYGGLWYLSPEQLKDLKYDFKNDIWGIGIILYMMITFENPFSKCDSKEEVFEKLKKKKLLKVIMN